MVDGDTLDRHPHRRPGLLDQPVLGVAHVGGGEGQAVAEVRDLIRTFKAMMSIHEATPRRRHGRRGRHDGDRATTADAAAVDPESLGELAALQGVVKFPVRIKCATLSWNTLAQGLDEAESPVTRRSVD